MNWSKVREHEMKIYNENFPTAYKKNNNFSAQSGAPSEKQYVRTSS